ncbi:MAG: acetoin utilization protein AcuC [Candidatus Methanosuratincola petrocarbonis]
MVKLVGCAAFIYDDSVLKYDFGSGHPFKVRRVRMARDRLLGYSQDLYVENARSASRAEAELFHEPGYLDLVKRFSATGAGLLDGGDTPAFRGCYEASLSVVGATLRAVELLLEGKYAHAASFAGGLHHASRGSASGFCIMNDCAVALALLRKLFSKVAYVDLDAHHGDGVMYGFYSDPGVVCVDVHQDGKTLFPGTGSHLEAGSGEAKGTKLNIPLPPGSADDVFVSLFSELAVPFLEEAKPEFIIVQCGADGLKGDPLAGLSFTQHGYLKVIEMVHEISHRICGGRLVLVGGGGYNPEATAECWAGEYMVLSGRAPMCASNPSTSLPSVMRKAESVRSAIRESHPSFSG